MWTSAWTSAATRHDFRRLRTPKNPPLPAGLCEADGGTRTPDPIITSDVLYQLSYVGEAVGAEGGRVDTKRLKMVPTVTSGAESRFRTVDTHLKLLAEVGLAATAAETAAGEGEIGVADDALDRAAEALAELRAAWPEMSRAERSIVGPAATALRGRIDRARVRLPRRFALSEGAPERDPDEEVDPARAA